MKKNRKTDDSAQPASDPGLSLEKAEKSSHFSLWELILPLRVLLPYLLHVAPLLERTSRGSPQLNELSRGVAIIQSGSRDLETLTRNQTLQLERMEDHLARLEAAQQNILEESRSFYAEMRSFRLWTVRLLLIIALLIGGTAGMVLYLLLHP